MVRIGVDRHQQQEAVRCLREEFPDHHDFYEICDPWKSSYQPGSDTPDTDHTDQRSATNRITLCPSRIIFSTVYRFLFSGAINLQGLTVAHGSKTEENILVDDVAVGTCRESYLEPLTRQSGERLHADLALLKLNPQRCLIDNTVRWPLGIQPKTFRIKIYKGPEVPKDTKVMILDQRSEFQYGVIRRPHETDKRLKVYDVQAICRSDGTVDTRITQEGDSGALVMSYPDNDSHVVYVYGIVTGILKNENDNSSYTVANRLWDVIRELCTNPNYQTELRGTDNTWVDIDFV